MTAIEKLRVSTRGRWKRHELECAKALGGKRNPCTGGEHTDVDAGPWAIEHKLRSKLPRLVVKAMEQAIRSCPEHKTPLVILSESTQGRQTDRYVVMRFADFVDWHGKIEAGLRRANQ